MGSLSIWHWVIVLVVVLLLFGRGKIPMLMGDMAKGIKAFKSGMKEAPEAEKIDADTPAASADDSAAGVANENINKDKAAEG